MPEGCAERGPEGEGAGGSQPTVAEEETRPLTSQLSPPLASRAPRQLHLAEPAHTLPEQEVWVVQDVLLNCHPCPMNLS